MKYFCVHVSDIEPNDLLRPFHARSFHWAVHIMQWIYIVFRWIFLFLFSFRSRSNTPYEIKSLCVLLHFQCGGFVSCLFIIDRIHTNCLKYEHEAPFYRLSVNSLGVSATQWCWSIRHFWFEKLVSLERNQAKWQKAKRFNSNHKGKTSPIKTKSTWERDMALATFNRKMPMFCKC